MECPSRWALRGTVGIELSIWDICLGTGTGLTPVNASQARAGHLMGRLGKINLHTSIQKLWSSVFLTNNSSSADAQMRSRVQSKIAEMHKDQDTCNLYL